MNEPTLHQAIGGDAAIEAAVEHFYGRVLADDRLAPFFARTDVRRLKAHQRAFLSTALQGPSSYSGRGMRAAHAGLGITDEDFDRVAHHLAETLIGLGVDEALCAAVLARIAPLRTEIVAASAAPASPEAAG